MDAFMNHFIERQGFYSLLLALVVAGATVAYTYLTNKLVKANQLAFDHINKESVRPNVLVLLRLKYNWGLRCEIINVGAGPALDVLVTFKAIEGSPEDNFPFDKVTIATLGNGLKHSAFEVDYDGFDFSDRQVSLSYSDSTGNRYKSSFVLDAASMDYISLIAGSEFREHSEQIVEAIQGIKLR